jgi:hypothetical protein
LGNQSSAPDSYQLTGWDIQLQPPFGSVRAFARQRGIERDIRSCQGGAKRLAFIAHADAKEIQEITEATVDRTEAEAMCVVDKFCHANVVVAHPEAFGNVGNSAALFGVAETVNDGAFEVADLDRLLFCDPVFCVAKKILGLQQNKTELRSVQRLFGNAFGARNEYDKLRLCHLAVKFHGRRVRKEVGSVAYQVTRNQVGISGVFSRASKFRRHDDKEAALNLGHESSLSGLMKQAAGERKREAGNLRGLCRREHGAP